MRRTIIVSLLFIVSSVLFAQDMPRTEVFLGASYLNVDTNGETSRLNAPGADFAFIANVTPEIGIETNFAFHYKPVNIDNLVTVDFRDFALTFGPRRYYKWAYVHALVGIDDIDGSAYGVEASTASFGAVIGGGITHRFTKHIAFEAGVDYYLTHHDDVQNNIRAVAGIGFTFGRVRDSEEPAQSRSPSISQSTPLPKRTGSNRTAITALGVIVISGRSTGVEIVDVTPNSVASSAKLHVGDVINAIDGGAVKTPADLISMLSAKPSGSGIRIGYLINGGWQTETTIVLP